MLKNGLRVEKRSLITAIVACTVFDTTRNGKGATTHMPQTPQATKMARGPQTASQGEAAKAPCDDRRVARTKRTLRRALSQLIEERHGIDNVTVAQITERADLNRGTFYAHYADKNDLLRSAEDEFLAQVTSMQQSIKKVTLEDACLAAVTGEPLPFAVSLYDFLRENGEFIRALLGPYGDAGFQMRLRDTVSTYLVESILTPSYREHMTPLTEYYIAYFASAQLGVIQHWLDRDMRESSEEMARMVLSIMFMRVGDEISLDTPAKRAGDAGAAIADDIEPTGSEARQAAASEE